MKSLTNSKNRLLTGISFLFAIILISSSCNKASNDAMLGMGNTGGTTGSAKPGANEVFIQGMVFNPSTITVAAGTTITWTNKDAVTHSVTSTTNVFNSGSMGANKTFSFTFATAGTYAYYCTFHPTMTASVTVN
jgi:plastocyanin